MTKSMTAFARASSVGAEGELTWELRSVNHRFLEPVVRLPEELRDLDPTVRERLRSRLGRGKVDCTLRFQALSGAGGSLSVNLPYVRELLAAGKQVAELVGEEPAPPVFDLLSWPGVLKEQTPDLTPVRARALDLLNASLDSLIATRAREGGRLADLLRDRCERLSVCVLAVRERMPQVMVGIRQRILDRLEEVRGELDPNRLEQELALLAQRMDVDEEMDRLGSHLQEVRGALKSAEPVGRRLDFLMQELNREANTLGSKSADVKVTRLSVEMKVLIEQMREQVQNIE